MPQNDETQLSNDSVVEWLNALYPLGPCIHALVHLLTLLHKWLGRIKPAISPKPLEIERTINFTIKLT